MHLPVVVLALVLGACAPMPEATFDGQTLRVDRASYRAGDAVELTLVNGSNAQVGYNLCVAGLDRRTGGEWVVVPRPLAEACTMELRTLEPAASANYRHTLPAGLTPGEYRIRTGVESPLGGARIGVASNPFQVVQ